MSYPYENLVNTQAPQSLIHLEVWPDSGQRNLTIQVEGLTTGKPGQILLLNNNGRESSIILP